MSEQDTALIEEAELERLGLALDLLFRPDLIISGRSVSGFYLSDDGLPRYGHLARRNKGELWIDMLSRAEQRLSARDGEG